LIDRNKPRKRKPRIGHRRNSNPKSFNNQHNNVPKSKVGVSKALEKYTSLAQDAYSNGDRIVAENFYQYAEHYQRVLNEQFGLESKPSKDHFNKEAIDDQSGSFDNIKPSRTQRAINAKSNRLNDNKVQDTSDDQKASKENYTSDGIEALKPFESSLNGEKTQSS
jgi:rubrerythrin